jgi:hypothetical protein
VDKRSRSEILEHINVIRIGMAEMKLDIAEMRDSIIRMSEAFDRMTKQVAVAIGDVYVEAPSVCPDLSEGHYA